MATGDEFGVVRAHIKMCPPSHSGPHVRKRYLGLSFEVLSDLPVIAKATLTRSAQEKVYGNGGENSQTRMHQTQNANYTPSAVMENNLFANFRFGLLSSNPFTELTIAPTCWSGYKPFKISRPIYKFSEVGQTR